MHLKGISVFLPFLLPRILGQILPIPRTYIPQFTRSHAPHPARPYFTNSRPVTDSTSLGTATASTVKL